MGNVMDYLIRLLIEQLVSKGVKLGSISAFIRDVAATIASNPHTDLSKLNRRLQMEGWNNVELDDFTLQLIAVNFEPDLTHESGHWSEATENLTRLQEKGIRETR